jgi:hypothetical protein
MSNGIHVIDHSATLETLLEPLRDELGQDYLGYRNHLYRVLTYTLHFLDGDQTHRRLIETALVYHDIGLWTDDDLAYLQPSVLRAQAADAENDWGLDTRLLSDIILAHHKVTPFRGPNARLVNAFRMADWIDATGGARRMGLSKAEIAAVTDAVPDAGFSDALGRLVKDLGGGRIRGYARVFRNVYKW